MGQKKVGRPRTEGDRYPGGKKKPPPKIPDISTLSPMSGATWQRMLRDNAKVFNDPSFATELTRLGATGQITAGEVAIGLRIAGIYGRFEYFKNLRRSAASPYYIREYVSAGGDTEAVNFQSLEGRERDRTFDVDDREQREQDAVADFKLLQQIIPPACRAEVEELCVENRHLGYAQLLVARQVFAIVSDGLPDKTTGLSKKKRRSMRRRIRPQLEPATRAKPVKINALKEAFLIVQRKINPKLSDEQLEFAWDAMNALKSRADFRQEKSGGRST